MNSWLFSRLREFCNRTAMIWREQEYGYRWLLERTEFWRTRLESLDIQAGKSVALIGDSTPESCALLLALIRNRNVIVPLKPDAEGKFCDCLEIGQVSTVFRIDAQDVCNLSRRESAAGHPLQDRLREDGSAGLVLFTSGSTGSSKAALLSVNRFLERFTKRRQPFRTLMLMGMDHIGGLNTLFHVLCDGGLLISLSQRTPQAAAEAIERHRVQLLPGTPTFLRMLLISGAPEEYDLSSLELITYGTEPMPSSTLDSLNAVFPNVRLKQTYGLSELGIMPTVSLDSRSLWMKVGGSDCETRVRDGTLWVRSRTAMLGYLNAPSPFDSDGWYDTGDAVETNGDYLRIAGRVSEMINVGGEKVEPAEVENVLLQMDNIADATVSGKPNPLTGNVVVATVRLREPEDKDHLERRLYEFCSERLAAYKIPVLVHVSDQEQHSARFKKVRCREPGVAVEGG